MKDELVQLLAHHHAICVAGHSESASSNIFQALEEVFAISSHGHPDLFRYGESPLSIETARRICADQSRKPVKAERTVVIIESDVISPISQNALLKLVEDPAPSTVFIFHLPRLDGLLPTLRSRFAVIEENNKVDHETGSVDAEVFLRSVIPVRLAMLKPIIEEKDKDQARRFLDDCERALVGERGSDGMLSEKQRDSLEVILKYKQYIGDPGSSLKLLLEYITLRV